MSKITLYSARACPYAHRTRLVLAEKELDFEVVEIDLQNKPSWFSTVSAYGKVPAITHDGHHIWESAVINEYLDEVFVEPKLLPSEPLQRAHARIWVDYANTRFAPAFGTLLRAQTDAEQAPARQELAHALHFIEHEGLARRAEVGPFFLGDEPSLVDFAFYPWLERWEALQHYRGFAIPSELHRLQLWRSAVRSLDSVKSQQSSTEYYVERYARHAQPNKPVEKKSAPRTTARAESRETP